MTDDTIAGYESIESTNVPLGIIEDIGIDSEIIQNHSLKQWEKGMSLPPLPNIICDELADAENPTNNASIKEESNEEEEEAKINI